MRKHHSQYGITSRVLGREYMKVVDYFSNLKMIAKSYPFRKVPSHLREISKELAMELAEKNQ